MPDLRIAAEMSETEIKRERAAAILRASLRELTANLMRIVRGAGKPYDVGEQLVAALSAFKDYREAVGEWPSQYEISEALSIPNALDGLRQGKAEGRITAQDWEQWSADG